jgi:pSer/pThr/pTyr-binding forkhead associated (FHA) protein
LNCKQASRKHAEIVFENGKYTLKDLDSKWGTRFKGQRITEVPLQFGD